MPLFRLILSVALLVMPAMLLSAGPAAAQMFYRQWSYFGDIYQRPPAYVRPTPLPPGEITDIMAEDYHFRRISQPQFAGHFYVVDGVDRKGATVRAFVDAFNGRLINVDLLQAAPRQIGREQSSGPRLARLPDQSERPRTTPLPPRRPAEAGPAPADAPTPRQAARPPAAVPIAPNAASPGTSPIVPLSREPRVVNPAEVRVPDEIDRAPPLTRPAQPAPAVDTPPVQPQASAPQTPPLRPAPGASPVAPAPLDDAVRQPVRPGGPAIPPSPLL